MKRALFFVVSMMFSAASAMAADGAVTAPTIDTAGMSSVGTSILAALAVVAGVSLMIKMIRKA